MSYHILVQHILFHSISFRFSTFQSVQFCRFLRCFRRW